MPMQNLVPEATIQVILTMWCLSMAPKVLPRLHYSGCSFIVALKDYEELILEPEDRINLLGQE